MARTTARVRRQELQEEGITTRIIADAAVAREMEVIDVVLVGAEGCRKTAASSIKWAR